MTQAYNLSQLANNLNSSGQLDATDGLVNAVPVANGGTGASTASAARSNLGLGTMATQNANSVAISGGTVTGITDLAVADGGTGASTLSGVVYGNGTSAFTAATAAQIVNAIGSTSVANATNAATATDVTNAVGSGQTWQAFSSPTRQSGVTYTNSTSKPIMVSVSLGAATSGAAFSVVVGGVQIAAGTIFSNWITHSFIVPVGTTYVVTCAALGWAELR